MSKEHSSHETKKKPQKSLKEKRAEKRLKGQAAETDKAVK